MCSCTHLFLCPLVTCSEFLCHFCPCVRIDSLLLSLKLLIRMLRAQRHGPSTVLTCISYEPAKSLVNDLILRRLYMYCNGTHSFKRLVEPHIMSSKVERGECYIFLIIRVPKTTRVTRVVLKIESLSKRTHITWSS